MEVLLLQLGCLKRLLISLVLSGFSFVVFSMLYTALKVVGWSQVFALCAATAIQSRNSATEA